MAGSNHTRSPQGEYIFVPKGTTLNTLSKELKKMLLTSIEKQQTESKLVLNCNKQ